MTRTMTTILVLHIIREAFKKTVKVVSISLIVNFFISYLGLIDNEMDFEINFFFPSQRKNFCPS